MIPYKYINLTLQICVSGNYFIENLKYTCSHFFKYRTLTTPVELIRCLRSIKEHAFVASEYPVVITLEDHLTPDLQAKVAEVS
jgi:hypothetical protein